MGFDPDLSKPSPPRRRRPLISDWGAFWLAVAMIICGYFWLASQQPDTAVRIGTAAVLGVLGIFFILFGRF
jgi:hypothetical protein